MTDLLSRDALLSQIAAVKEEIAHLEAASPMVTPSDDSIVNHLLRNNITEARALDDKSDARVDQWSAPLPVPTELEDPLRMDALIEGSGEVYGGLRLEPLVKGDNEDKWKLRGLVGDGSIEFEATFQVAAEHPTHRCIRNVEVLVSEDAVAEATPLVQHAVATNCLRTLIVGLSEYGALYRARNLAFENATLQVPQCERLDPTRLKVTSADGAKHVVVEWTCVFRPYGDPQDLASEFMPPILRICEFNLGPGAMQAARDAFQRSIDPGFAALVRLSGGLTPAVAALVQAMN